MDGTITETLAPEGGEVTVGGPLFKIVPGDVPAAVAAAPAQAAPAPAAASSSKAAAPAASKAAPAPAAAKSDAGKKPAAAAAPARPVETGARTETRVKMTRMRQRIAQRLKEAQNTAAMLTTFQEVDMTKLIALRNTYKDDFEKVHGVKMGFMSAFVRVWRNYSILLLPLRLSCAMSSAKTLLYCLIFVVCCVLCYLCMISPVLYYHLIHQHDIMLIMLIIMFPLRIQAATLTLQEIPAVNGVIDDATQEIVYRHYVDVSVAVASPTGLVVPVLRNTDKMNFAVNSFC